MKLTGKRREAQETILPGDTGPGPEGLGDAADPEASGGSRPEAPAWLRLLVRGALRVILLSAVVAFLTGSLTGVRPGRRRSLRGQLPGRVRCLHRGVNSTQCLGCGCLWSPQREGPSCHLPPPSVHGYAAVGPPEAPLAGVTLLRLALKGGSARAAGSLKEELALRMTEHGEDVFRIQVTVPEEARYEVPAPLDLPEVGAPRRPKYEVSFGDPEEGFSLVVRRPGTDAVVFDSSDVGGFTYGDQFLQVSTRLPSGSLYGLGEASHASFRHGFQYKSWSLFARGSLNHEDGGGTNGVHPMYMFVDGEGRSHVVLWLNSNAMEAETTPLPSLTLSAIGGIVDLIFFMGPSPKEALTQYARVVGLPALPPYWALGFQLSRSGYRSLEALKASVSRTRRHGIPQDVQHVDVDHLDRRLGFTYDEVRFAGLPEYVRDVKGQGLRFSVVLYPGINAEMDQDEYPVHQRALRSDAYVRWPQEEEEEEEEALPSNRSDDGGGDVMFGYAWPGSRAAFPDFFRTATRKWWQDEIRRHHQVLGFDGISLDMNEPTLFGTNQDPLPEGLTKEEERKPPLTCPLSPLDDPPYVGTAAGGRLSDTTLCMEGRQGEDRSLRHYDVHNIYGWSQTRPTLRGLRQATQKRGVVVSRSTFPGSGRWAGHWLASTRSQWSYLRRSIVGMLEFNLFGVPFVGADICGFFQDTTEELCERWMQLGAFYPFSRNHNHAQARDQDPGIWPSVASSSRIALRVRYALLPYLYTLHYIASTQGTPVVRPLFLEFPRDQNTFGIDDQFLWGSWLMIAPIIEPGTPSREVYFPEGVWYDYYNGTAVVTREPRWGSRTQVPLFARGGGILVSQRPRANTLLSRREPLGLIVSPDAEGEAKGTFYWDEGESIDPIGTGNYFTANISYANESLAWEASHDGGGAAVGMLVSDVRVSGVLRRPVYLKVAGARWTVGDWHYDGYKQVLEMFDLEIPVEAGFTLSWSYEMDFRIPCPISYKDWNEDMPVTEAMCQARNCVWDPLNHDSFADENLTETGRAQQNQVRCSVPPPSDYGFEFEDGFVHRTKKGFRTLLKKRGPSLYGQDAGSLTFEVFRYSRETLRFKLYETGVRRFEVPIDLNLPEGDVGEALYEVVLPENPREGEPFFFYVVRRDTGTVLFDTRIGGLTFSDQFLSITSTLPSKNVYGMGENAHDSFRHDFGGKVWPIFSRDQGPEPGTGRQVNLYGVHPYYQCLENDGRAHGVLLLNSNAMDYQMLDYPAISYRTIGGVLDFYMVLGPEPESVVSQYTALLHRPVMPPYWALGFHLCRYGYRSLEDLEAAVNRTREAGIPQDVQYGDIDYMSRRLDFTVDQEHFGGFPEYVVRAKEKGLRFIVILDPAINAELPASEYPTHRRALSADAYVKWPERTDGDVVSHNNGGAVDVGRTMLGYVWPDNRTAFPSFFKPSARDWWVQEIIRFYETLKFDGLWIDMNEPANFGTNEARPWNWPPNQEPWSLKCPENRWDDPPYVTKAGSMGPSGRMSDKTLCMWAEDGPHRHYDAHSLYGWAQAEATLRAATGATGKRSLVISRSTFPGSGRWAGHWLGDNRSTWTDMAHSIIGMLEFNLFGVPFVGADICGFFQDTTEELCERWMQLGAFYPFSRNHNQKDAVDQDPGLWPETVGRSSKKVMEIRYLLLPYLYTLFYLANTEGSTVVRPLLHEFPRDRRTFGLHDQFLWGPALMVSPVLQEGALQRVVYFPFDAWYDLHSGKPVEWPGEYVTVPAPRDVIPLHLRGGHVLPTQRPALNTREARKEPLGLLVPLGLDGRASGRLFWDDGEALDGASCGVVVFSFDQGILTSSVLQDLNGSLEGLKLVDLEFLGVREEPSRVLLDREKDLRASSTYEPDAMRLRIAADLDLGRSFTLELR